MLTTMKLFSPLSAQLYEKNEWGGLEDEPVDLGADEICAYQGEILEAIKRERLDTEGERGLAVYLDNEMLKRKVYRMAPTVEEWDGRLWGVLEVQSYGRLSNSDLTAVIQEWSGQESDGWGEGVGQREIKVDSGGLCVSFWHPGPHFFIKTEQELKLQSFFFLPIRVQVNIRADEYREKRGYEGADVELPASRYALEDALQRARVPEGGSYGLQRFLKWPPFLSRYLDHSGEKTLEELNLLAGKIAEMDKIQLATFEGALKLRADGDTDTPISIRELINYAYNLDSFEFHPGVAGDRDLGKIAMMGGMLDIIDGLPDEAAELLDEQKVGQALRHADQGTFTGSGYVYRGSTDWKEAYDGIHLLDLPEEHSLVSLWLEPVERNHREDGGVWLELPAGETNLQGALASLGETSFANCRIAGVESVLPSLEYQLAGDEDIGKLNILSSRLAAFPESKTLMKYKAALELECFPDLDRMLDITQNLGCYDFDRRIATPTGYAEYLLQEAGFDTTDPAFARFDFAGYGERRFEQDGGTPTQYGAINRNDKPFIHEYSIPRQGMEMA